MSRLCNYVCLLFIAYAASHSMAEESTPIREANLKLSLGVSQQEHGLQYSEIYGPNMGDFGRLGLNLGSSRYFIAGAADKSTYFYSNQLGISWFLSNEIWKNSQGDSNTALAWYSTIRYGKSQYEYLLDGLKKEDGFNFLEVEMGFEFALYPKEFSAKFFKSSYVAFGSSFRSNYINEQRNVGDETVDSLRVSPSFAVGAYL